MRAWLLGAFGFGTIFWCVLGISLAHAQTGGGNAAGATVSNIFLTSPTASSLTFNGSGVTITGTGTPTCASTGTGCTNSSGTVTAGSAATSVVITFNGTFGTGVPTCVVWPATQLVAFSAVVSATAITITQTATTGDQISYVCFPH